MCNARFAQIVQDDISNGDGLGEVLFFQYCTHHCKGCQNPQTWDKDGGYKFTDKYLNILLDYFDKNTIATRLTLSGGDPLDSLEMATLVAREFKRRFPNKSLWVYTGYLFSDLLAREDCGELLRYCDILVDGEFKQDCKDTTLYCKGSSNQRVIDVQETLKRKEIVIHEQENY